jgi:cytidine deaminase
MEVKALAAVVERLDRARAAQREPAFPELLDVALRAQANARVPYSNFHVGAAVLAGGGAIYGGCNVESASYGATICAERSAAVSAVSAGEKTILTVVVVSPTPEPSTPCGICRQLLVEFGAQMTVFTASSVSDAVDVTTLAELLPLSFSAADLEAAAQ